MFFSRWCRRHPAHFTAVGAAFYTTARVNAAGFTAAGVGVMLPILLLLVPLLHYGEGKSCPFSAVGVGVMLPILLLLVPPSTLRRG